MSEVVVYQGSSAQELVAELRNSAACAATIEMQSQAEHLRLAARDSEQDAARQRLLDRRSRLISAILSWQDVPEFEPVMRDAAFAAVLRAEGELTAAAITCGVDEEVAREGARKMREHYAKHRSEEVRRQGVPHHSGNQSRKRDGQFQEVAV